MGEAETTKTTTEKAPARAVQADTRAWLLGALGWAIPGLGHFLQRKFDRALVFFVSIATMAGLGLAMGGKLYRPPFDWSQGMFTSLLHILAFLGDLGAGALFFGAQMAGLGHSYMNRALGDYGTVFFLGAGLLNLLTALDAYDIAVGKKD